MALASVLVLVLVVALPVASGIWAYRDGTARGLTSGTALGAALLVALTFPLGIAVWLLLRERIVPALTV